MKKTQINKSNWLSLTNTWKNREILAESPAKKRSAVTGENTQDLMRRLQKLVNSLPAVDDLFDGETVKELDSPAAEDTGFDIETDPAYPDQFRITGTRIIQIARMTTWDYYEAVQRFQRVMEAMGVDDALTKAGAKTGDLIMIDEWDFDYS